MRGAHNYQALGRLKAGVMNKTETLYAQKLELQRINGEILWYQFEPANLKLSQGCYYRIDFMVLTKDSKLQVHEVKGGYITDDSLVKIKVAAEKFPFDFFIYQYKKKIWEIREF